MNSGGDHYTPKGPQDFTNPVVYTVFNTDDSKSKEYTVTLTVIQTAWTDATLKSLTVNVVTVALEADKTDYTVDLPHNTTEVPEVKATANDPRATVDITPATDLKGQTIIDVTAEDGVTKLQYSVSFNVLAPPEKPVTIWNFSEAPFVPGSIEGTFDGLTIVSHPTGTPVDIDANTKSIDGFSFTHRLRLGGAGSPAEETPYLPTVRYLSFDTKGDAIITIYGMSSSGGAERKLAITDGENEIGIFTDDQVENTIKKGIIEYTGPATTIYIYSLNSGFNVYAIVVEEDINSSLGIENVTLYKEVKSVSYYDIMGRPVPTATRGLIIVKTTYMDGSSTSDKVYRLEK
jgi:PKD repeat protein